MDSEKKTWGPAWRYGPNGAADIFQNEGDVPAGWVDHPSKVGEAKQPAAQRQQAAPTPTPTPTPASTPAPVAAASDPEVDRDGHPWNAALHASSKSRTKDDLWRMKVGVARPGPLPGYPKPAAQPLDL